MKHESERKRRIHLGRVSVETKGPPGVFMEATGLWDHRSLSN
jgi:hypothetical protein